MEEAKLDEIRPAKEAETQDTPYLPEQAEASTPVPPPNTAEEEIARLQKELSDLREEHARAERQQRELQEFAELFPEVSLDSVPSEILTQTALPLTAAYALYLCKQRQLERAAGEINAKNAEKSSGALQNDGNEGGLFTREEIKKMTQKEVHRHYQTILKSLQKKKN